MLVTTIKKIDKRKSVIYIDYEKCFQLYNTEIRRYHISENDILDDNTYKVIMEEILPKRCFERSLYVLKDSNKTEFQIREKLRNNNYPIEIIDSVIEKLKKLHYVDDFQYCYDYYLYHMNQKSKKKLYFDLMRKGISKNIFDDVILTLEENGEKIDETQNILLTNNVEKLCKKNDYNDPKIYQKLLASLMRKGFKYDDILKAFNLIKDRED